MSINYSGCSPCERRTASKLGTEDGRARYREYDYGVWEANASTSGDIEIWFSLTARETPEAYKQAFR